MEHAQDYPGGGSRTLVTQKGDDVSLGVVLEDSVRARLAAADPRVHLDRGNLDPFCVAAEEVSHFVYLFFCARATRQVTQLELELQGEVDKYLSVRVPPLASRTKARCRLSCASCSSGSYRLAAHVTDEEGRAALPPGQRPRLSLLRVPRVAFPAGPRASRSSPARRGASTASASATSSSASRPCSEHAPLGTTSSPRRSRRARQLRLIVDLTSSVIVQGGIDRDEAEALVAATRRRALELFPGKEDTFDLVLAPRFARLIREFAANQPAGGRSAANQPAGGRSAANQPAGGRSASPARPANVVPFRRR